MNCNFVTKQAHVNIDAQDGTQPKIAATTITAYSLDPLKATEKTTNDRSRSRYSALCTKTYFMKNITCEPESSLRVQFFIIYSNVCEGCTKAVLKRLVLISDVIIDP